MSDMLTIILSIAVIAAFVLGGGGIAILLKHPEDRKKGFLMLGVGIVTLINVALLSTPLP